MNKSQLIDAIAKDANLTKADTKRALDSFMKTTSDTLKKGERIALVGFGSFEVKKRAARKGRNPQKPNQVINIPAKNVIKFKAGSDLTDRVQ